MANQHNQATLVITQVEYLGSEEKGEARVIRKKWKHGELPE
jgi:hypothetical protein